MKERERKEAVTSRQYLSSFRHAAAVQSRLTSCVSFELFVELVNECDQPHWRPQSGRMEPKYYKYINFVGHYESIKNDAMELLQKCGAWEKYGRNGWGDDGTKSIFETSSTWTVTSAMQLYPQNYPKSIETITKEGSVYRTDSKRRFWASERSTGHYFEELRFYGYPKDR
jgi:hypothetical protein